MSTDFVLESSEKEVTPAPENVPLEEVPAGEEEAAEEQTEEGAEEHEEGAEEGGEKKTPEHKEPPIPKEAEPHLARMRRAHERELKIARLEERNKVLEEIVLKGGKVPTGDKPADGGKPADQGASDFVFAEPRPQRAEFEGTEEEYEDARDAWRDRRNEARKAWDSSKATAQTANELGAKIYAKWKEDAGTRLPDFDKKLAEAKDKGITVTGSVAEGIRNLGGRYMPDLLYHFATHPEEAKKVNAMEPLDAFDAIEDLRDSIASTLKGKLKSKTPNPPPRLEADTGAEGADEWDPKLSAEQRIELSKARRAREASGAKKR